MVNYEVGDIITYQPFGGGERNVKVTFKSDDIKNGQPGFDGHLVGGDHMVVWGYDDQILTIR